MDAYTQYDIITAAKLLYNLLGDSAPNWLRMLAGASDESMTNPELWNALLDEVKAALEE
jgi:hypothetical protein